jgi:6,7-dimethyl-8-ribityllumazine synthase
MALPESATDAPHLMIVEARDHDDIVEELVRGALQKLDTAGVSYERFAVPTPLEIPVTMVYAMRSMEFFTARRRFNGYVVLGCIMRGETTHYDMMATETARGLQDLARTHALAIGNGILTVENGEQAWVRADVRQRNRGGVAAQACLDMIELKRQFRLYPR